MKAPVDLHPADREARLALRDTMVETRRSRHLSQADVARRMGVSEQAVSLIENTASWRLVTVQRVFAALGRRLVVDLAGVPTDPDAAVLDLLRPVDPDKAHAWDQRALATALGYARTELGLSQAEVGRRMGLTGKSVRQVESQPYGLLVATPQRICRALGGQLDFAIEVPARTAVAA